MATPQSPEQRELSLIGKVEMRIALADSDSKLESTLKTYLAPLLLKLASEHQSVRNKVITVCQHVNTRTKPESIQLPVAALIKQFQGQESSMIRHFDLLYIQQGVGRLSSSEKAELLPLVVKGIATSGNHGAQIFNLLLRLLEFYTLPMRGSKEDLSLRAQMDITDEDAQFLAKHMGKLFLFTPQKGTSPMCPGLTAEEYQFLILNGKECVWNPAAGGLNLLRTKVLAARLLASGIFTEKERFLPALFASADPSSSISDVADDIMKRCISSVDLEDQSLIHELHSLYSGTQGSQSQPRVRVPLRIKILGLLEKSIKSTESARWIERLVEDGLLVPITDGEDTVMTNGASNPGVGREAMKLRSAIFTYITFVARYGSVETLSLIATQVIGSLRDFLDNQGWPKAGPTEDLVSRGYAYEVIGLLAKAGPRKVLIEAEQPTLDLLRWLLTSLAKDSSGRSIVVSIEESLSTVLSAFARLDLNKQEQSVLEDMLEDQMGQSADLEGNERERSTRYVTIRFANRCLPYSSVKARWVDILGIGATSDRAEVREEAERGMSPYWHRMLNGSTVISGQQTEPDFPGFSDVMTQFFQGRTTNSAEEPLALVKHVSRAHAGIFKHMTAFARRMLFAESLQKAGITTKEDSEWERRLDVAVASDLEAREAVKSYLRSSVSIHGVQIETIMRAMFEGALIGVEADDSLVEFISLAPDALVQTIATSAAQLLPVLKVNDSARRTTAAHAYGLLASYPEVNSSEQRSRAEDIQSIVQNWSSAVGSATSHVHGCILALGFYFSRSSYRGQDMSSSTVFVNFVNSVLSIISECRDDLLKQAAYTALGQLCLFGCIRVADIERTTTIRAIVDAIYKTAKEGKETAILCLGQVSTILPEQKDIDEDDLTYIRSQLHKLHEIKQAEIHFTVGESFSYLAIGWKSGALATKLDIEGTKPPIAQRTETLRKLIEQTLADCANTKPALKKAAVIWLLCFVQFCGDEEEVQSKLPACQDAFKRCLSDRDELVQETASRGLGLVYEKGDRRLKDDLVRDLVSSFSSDKQSQLAGNVSADTQLFEPGALPTGDGSVSTYKDIMSLASEVGDSSLVYRFMSMASSNAIWSSRAAFGRFGLSNVLSDSSVDGYLANNPKLYPKLFRYRFDPNGGVQRSMNDIWNALVKDSSATIDKHFDAIMEDLLVSILGKEWRVRQASCAAIADLVSGRPLEKYEKYLERIWTQCFKVLDDIKESVRAAAASLARSMTGVLTRTLEADHSSTKNASAMLKHVLPFLLSPSGMESSAQEVQTFSVLTLLTIIKKANGTTLRPFIPELVERLIGMLSTLEPEAVNYVHLNAEKYNLTEQKIDDMRLSSVRGSPLMEAIERCLDLLDDETMGALQPRLQNAMKSAVGLPSKVGSSRVIVSLATRRAVIFRPFADDFLKTIEKLVIDRNETVSSSYAISAGYVARLASDKQILRTVSFTKRLYFESEGDREASVPRRSISAGEILFGMSKYASDRINGLASSVLPFVFVAKHDSHDQVKEQFQNTWDETVGGSRAVLLYLKEILELCNTHLDSPQWVLKHTASRAVADTVVAVSSLESKMSESVGEQLWPAIEKALSGKTWDGKEVVLAAFVKYVQNAQAHYMPRENVKAAITKIAVREAKRQNEAYRQHSVKALGNIALARQDLDMGETVISIIEPLVLPPEEAEDPDAMDTTDNGQTREAGYKMATRVAATNAIFASVNVTTLQAPALRASLQRAIHLMTKADRGSPEIRRALFTSIAQTFDRVRESGEAGTAEADRLLPFDASELKTLLFGPSTDVEATRMLRAEAIVAIGKASKGVLEQMRSEVEAVTAEEVSPGVRDRLGLAAKAHGL